MQKGFKTGATEGAQSIYDQIIKGGTQQAASNTQDVEHVQDVQKTQSKKKKSNKPKRERLNLLIPVDIKDYLQAAAYRASDEKHTVSLTEYLCDLVRADMEKHKDD